MTDDEIRTRTIARTRDYLDLLRKQDWKAWINLWAPDAVLEFPFAPASRQNRFEGTEAILEYMSGTTGRIAVDGVARLDIHPMLDPEKLTVELQIKGRLLENDAPYDQIYVTIFTFRDGKIAHYREYWNPLISIEAYGSVDAWLASSSAAAPATAS